MADDPNSARSSAQRRLRSSQESHPTQSSTVQISGSPTAISSCASTPRSSAYTAARSSVFHDMMPPPPPQPELDAGAGEITDGCPVVQLYDSAKEMTYFLKAIFDSEFYEPPGTHTPTLPPSAGVLRLSTKYDVPLPPHALPRPPRHRLPDHPPRVGPPRDGAHHPPRLDDTLIAAFGLPWILPAVIYCVCTHPVDYTLGGVPREWGAQDTEQCARAPRTLSPVRGGAPEHGRAGVRVHGGVRRGAHAVHVVRGLAERRGVPDPGRAPGDPGGHCARRGYAGFSAGYEAGKESMWEELPGMAGLPSWEELEKLGRAALQL